MKIQRTSFCVVVPVALALLLSACEGPQPAADPGRTIPVSVLVREAKSGITQEHPPLDPSRVTGEIARSLRIARVFSEVVTAEELEAKGSRSGRPDYICEVEVRGTYLSAKNSVVTNMALLSTFLWFMALIPGWFIDDRLYPNTDVEVEARLLPAGNGGDAKPSLVEVVPAKNLTLDFWRRAATWQYFVDLILPPFWMDDPEVVAESLPEAAIWKVRREMAEKFRRDWPAAALRGDPGCILVLDSPGGAIEVEDGRIDLQGYLAARSPMRELIIRNTQEKILLKMDRRILDPFLVPRNSENEKEREAWNAIEARLGPQSPSPQMLYSFNPLFVPATSSDRIHLEVQLEGGVRPARFTVFLQR